MMHGTVNLKNINIIILPIMRVREGEGDKYDRVDK
jgi:hypothetical protein